VPPAEAKHGRDGRGTQEGGHPAEGPARPAVSASSPPAVSVRLDPSAIGPPAEPPGQRPPRRHQTRGNGQDKRRQTTIAARRPDPERTTVARDKRVGAGVILVWSAAVLCSAALVWAVWCLSLLPSSAGSPKEKKEKLKRQSKALPHSRPNAPAQGP